MNKPKTIADLNINWTFTIEHRKFVYWELDFLLKNPKLKNYKIKEENYIFEIMIRDRKFEFSIMAVPYYNLYQFVHEIHNKIATIYENNFFMEGACFKLIKFKETVFFNVLVIEVEEC